MKKPFLKRPEILQIIAYLAIPFAFLIFFILGNSNLVGEDNLISSKVLLVGLGYGMPIFVIILLFYSALLAEKETTKKEDMFLETIIKKFKLLFKTIQSDIGPITKRTVLLMYGAIIISIVIVAFQFFLNNGAVNISTVVFDTILGSIILSLFLTVAIYVIKRNLKKQFSKINYFVIIYIFLTLVALISEILN